MKREYLQESVAHSCSNSTETFSLSKVIYLSHFLVSFTNFLLLTALPSSSLNIYTLSESFESFTSNLTGFQMTQKSVLLETIQHEM